MNASLRVQRLYADAALPARAHPGDAGLDLVSREQLEIRPGARAVVGTGIAVEIPSGWAGLVCPRSGLAANHGISIVNSPGLIDAGYRGELRVVLLNTDSDSSFVIRSGDRIAQLVLVQVGLPLVQEVDDLSDSARGARGFGSSGVAVEQA